MSLEALAAYAVKNNYVRSPSSSTPSYALSIEEAREAVVIKDGNKVANEDGSQALVLKIGRGNIALDVVKKGATRVNATADQVEAFTEALRAAVNAGDFDEAIREAQARLDPANAPVKTEEAGEDATESTEEVAPEGVDLDSLDV